MQGGGRIAVFGCGGHARSVINVICETSKEKDMIIIDEKVKNKEIILGYRTERECELDEKDVFIIAVGDNNNRKNLYRKLKGKHKGRCVSVVSMYAIIGMDAEIGQGTFIAQNAYVGPQAIIGDNTILNTGSIVEHEAIIGNHTHIAPGAIICGRTRIGNNVFCGAGSTIIDKITICDNVTIGAGAVVKEDILAAGTYVGVPAKRVK